MQLIIIRQCILITKPQQLNVMQVTVNDPRNM